MNTSTFILCLIGACLGGGGMWIAYDFVRDFRRAWREEFPRVNRRGPPRRRRRWPCEQHYSFFRDLKRSRFPEDVQ